MVFLKRLIQVHVHGSGKIKTLQGLQVTVSWALIQNLLSWDSHVQKVINNGKKVFIGFEYQYSCKKDNYC